MNTLDAVVAQLTSVRDRARAKLGRNDVNLTQAIDLLIAGYGTGGGGDIGGGEEVCSHNETYGSFKSNGDGTHNHKTICRICGEVLSEENKPCTGGAPVITANADGTHTTTEVCPYCCWEKQTTADCADADEDGVCDVCAGQMPTEPEDNAGWEYKAGELQSRSGYKFYVSDSVLSTTGASNYVALGAKASGGTPAAIPIPADASKLTITFGETGVTKVYFLFFIGSPSNATDPVDIYSADVVNGVCTFESRGATYVVFNCTGSWVSDIQKSQVGELATLKFE